MGVLYSGEINDSRDIGIDSEFLASFTHESTPAIQLDANLSAKDKAVLSAAYVGKEKTAYRIDELRPELSAAKKTQLKMEKLQAKSYGQMDANAMRQLAKLKQQYSGEVGSDNTNQLTIVQFVNEIVGKLEQPSFITTAFRHIALDRLRGKIPEMGWPAVNLQVKRLSEPEINYTEFGQQEFRIFRNDVHIYIPREDRMEATIDPFTTSVAQGQIQMLRARELLALKELSNLVYLGNGTAGELPDFTATGTEGVPHATNDGPKAFVNAMLTHFNTFFNYLKYFIWNPLDYRDYLSNWFSFAYNGVESPEGYGVVPLRGLEKYGAIAIISPYTPQGFVYALTNEGAYELDGPYIVDAEYDAKKFADYNIVHDFIGYKIMNPKRFGEKLKITATPPGTEITTNKQVYDKLKPPKDIVIKNATA